MTGDDRELYEFKPDWTFRPGVTLAEVLAERRLTPSQAAAVTGLPLETITGIGTGTIAIDEPAAEALQAGLGVSARFWLTHQADYEAALERGARDTSLDYVTDYPWIAAGNQGDQALPERMIVSAADYDTVTAALAEPPEPNGKLRAAIRRATGEGRP